MRPSVFYYQPSFAEIRSPRSVGDSAAAATTAADAAAGSGFSCFCAAVAATTAADADAANVLTCGGPFRRALNHCHMA